MLLALRSNHDLLKGFLLGCIILCRQAVTVCTYAVTVCIYAVTVCIYAVTVCIYAVTERIYAVTVWRIHPVQQKQRGRHAIANKDAQRLFAAVVSSPAVPCLAKYMTGDLISMW